MRISTDNQAVLDLVRDIFSRRIPFNHLLGLTVSDIAADHAKCRFEMRDELVGNYLRGSLHGGVISATLDVTGGLVAFLGALGRMESASHEEKVARFMRLGTIDLRVDYLRPGLGRRYEATGYVLRTGNKVAVTRMELHDETDKLIAVGTGTYVVS